MTHLITAKKSGKAEHPVEVGVAEAAVGVGALADSTEAVPFGVAGSQRRGRLIVHLPPVGSAAEGVHDRLDAPEVLLEGFADVAVHRDVTPLFAVRRRQGDVVGRYE